MNQALRREAAYAGFHIGLAGFSELEGLSVRVDIWSPDQDAVYDDPVSFIETIHLLVRRRSRSWPDDDEEAVHMLLERGLHRARGAILLDRVRELDGARFRVPRQEQYAQRSDEYLRALILNAFKRVFRYSPKERGRIDFDDVGVALMEGINPEDVEHILGRLHVEGRIEDAGIRQEPGYRFYKPTAAGLSQADRLAMPDRAPALLVEETVASVERVLGRHSPELVERLRGLAIRVAETDQLSLVDVGGMAQTCDLILQEFLDLPVLWEGITESKPPRDMTKDRLSMILKARVGSETEEELIKGLGNYLFGWFGPLDKFVNKHRHPLDPEQSTRLHAKRLLLYTYLLISDLIEVLGL